MGLWPKFCLFQTLQEYSYPNKRKPKYSLIKQYKNMKEGNNWQRAAFAIITPVASYVRTKIPNPPFLITFTSIYSVRLQKGQFCNSVRAVHWKGTDEKSDTACRALFLFSHTRLGYNNITVLICLDFVKISFALTIY